jgi:predicted HicB family RNase H-like nuclease
VSLSSPFSKKIYRRQCRKPAKPCGTRDCGDKKFLKITDGGVTFGGRELTSFRACDSISDTDHDERRQEHMATSEAHRRAAAKWQASNNETQTIKLRKGQDPSKADIRAAAERDGVSVNAWLIAAIKDKL